MKSTPRNLFDKEERVDLVNYVSWFEIPARNFERALKFYNEIYRLNMKKTMMGGYSMAFFPAQGGVGGTIVHGEGCIPSERGSLIYLNAGDDLNVMLKRIGSAGGRVILEKTFINEDSGYFALFIDTEGNRMALHSAN